MEIYIDNGLVYYTRVYNKLFLIISNVFPLFKLALYFIKIFTKHIKISYTKRNLAGLIFENKDTNKTINNPIKKIKIHAKIDVSQEEKDINNINNFK